MSSLHIIDTPAAKPMASMKNLPVNLFASVMGVSGLVLAWRQATHLYGASPIISESLGAIAVVMFLALSLGYLIKTLKYPHVVKNEFNHPIAGNFFGTATIATLLISSVIAPMSPFASEIIWTLGALCTFALAYIIVSSLLQGKIDASHALPVWLIPSVGTLDIPVAGGSMTMPWAHELNLFALAVGSILALVFFTLIIARLIHQDTIAPQLMPSMMILIAPFEVGFLAYTHFIQQVDQFAGLLFYFGLFLFLILAVKVFRKRIPFAAGWWAVSFPIAALANAALEYAGHVHAWPLTGLAILLLAFLSILIAVLAIRTLHILVNGKLLAA